MQIKNLIPDTFHKRFIKDTLKIIKRFFFWVSRELKALIFKSKRKKKFEIKMKSNLQISNAKNRSLLSPQQINIED